MIRGTLGVALGVAGADLIEASVLFPSPASPFMFAAGVTNVALGIVLSYSAGQGLYAAGTAAAQSPGISAPTAAQP